MIKQENPDDGCTEPEQLRKMFIGGLDFNTTDENLQKFYEQWGTVVDVVVMKDPKTKKSRGFGFITYTKSSMVDDAMANRPHKIDGRQVEPKRAIPREICAKSEANVRKLFIGGIGKQTTKEDLEEYFGKYGKMTDCAIVVTKDTGEPRGFGFVEYEDVDAADKVILLRDHEVRGRKVEVKKAIARDAIGGNDGGRRGGDRGGNRGYKDNRGGGNDFRNGQKNFDRGGGGGWSNQGGNWQGNNPWGQNDSGINSWNRGGGGGGGNNWGNNVWGNDSNGYDPGFNNMGNGMGNMGGGMGNMGGGMGNMGGSLGNMGGGLGNMGGGIGMGNMGMGGSMGNLGSGAMNSLAGGMSGNPNMFGGGGGIGGGGPGYNTFKGGSSSGGPMRGNFNSNRSAPYNTSGGGGGGNDRRGRFSR